ncbi:hypothetical protein CMUST_06265 [Corynebacterium mustelae]|uniref:Endonuclease GajA/Old nuclease/RecF-like AAA domain-containing protein n=1 Tax=Corynebacterium mustelae TaxID=571915 RepID=A0A0G3GWP8_9CORY|nr:AAA family ATPase [Corynebacterium mustelae]AKK05589.1 hypothetical protein CMUST_06265 [Corynebacterium mustelae]
MKITFIEIENYKSISQFTWHNIPDRGVLVISGENEKGKSTVLDALHQALFSKHNSKAAAVKASQPIGKDIGPRVKLGLVFGQIRCELEKQWLKSPMAVVTVAGADYGNGSFTGAEAEQRLQQLLDDHLDHQLFETLFNKQGKLTPAMELVGISALKSALDQSEDSFVGETESTELMHRVTAEYERYFSKRTGAPTKYLKDHVAALETARLRRREAETKRASLQQRVDLVEQITADKDHAQLELPMVIAQYEKLQAEWELAHNAEKKVELKRREYQISHAQCEAVSAKRDQRRERLELVTQLEARVLSLRETLQQHEDAATIEKHNLDRLKLQRDDCETAVTMAHTAHRSAVTVMQEAQRADRRSEHRLLIEQLDDIDRRIEELAAVSEVSAEAVTAFSEAELAVRATEQALAVHSPSVTFHSETPRTICINGEETAISVEPETLSLEAETEITVEDISIIINPGIGIVGVIEQLAAAQENLKTLQSEYGFDSAAQAQSALERYTASQTERKLLITQRHVIVGEQSELEIRQELAKPAPDVELSVTEAAEQLAQAASALDNAIAARDEAVAVYEVLARRPAETDFIATRTLFDEACDQLNREKQVMAAVESETPLEALDIEYRKHKSATQERENELAKMESELEQLAPELKRQLAEAASAQLADVEDRIRQAETTIAAHRSYIEAFAGAAEECDLAMAAEIAAERKEATVQARAAAAKLLYETLLRHQKQAHARYSAPFTQELTRLAKPVFGSDVSFELSEALEVTSRIKNDEKVSVESLSGGAQEQLAILTRLAVASLVSADRVPVFFDDVLGSTDPSRLLSMGAVFNDVGQQQQIFVFTCVPQRYASVASRVEKPMHGLMENE